MSRTPVDHSRHSSFVLRSLVNSNGPSRKLSSTQFRLLEHLGRGFVDVQVISSIQDRIP